MNYIVFADIEYNGFVIEMYDNLPTAKIVMNKIWELGNPPTPFSLQDLTEMFTDKSVARYELNEEHLFYEKFIEAQSNGYYTVGIVEINDSFTLEAYLESRDPN